MENPIKMDDLKVPPFKETSNIYTSQVVAPLLTNHERQPFGMEKDLEGWAPRTWRIRWRKNPQGFLSKNVVLLIAQLGPGVRITTIYYLQTII